MWLSLYDTIGSVGVGIVPTAAVLEFREWLEPRSTEIYNIGRARALSWQYSVADKIKNFMTPYLVLQKYDNDNTC